MAHHSSVLVKPYTANLIFSSVLARAEGPEPTPRNLPFVLVYCSYACLTELSKEERWKCELKAAASHNLRNGDSRRCDDAGWPPVEWKRSGWCPQVSVSGWWPSVRLIHANPAIHSTISLVISERAGSGSHRIPCLGGRTSVESHGA